MKKAKRLFGAFLSMAMAFTAFAGCTVTSNNKPAATGNSTAATTTQKPSSTAEQKFKGQTLRMMGHDNPYVRSLKALAPKFEEITGAKLEIDAVGQAILEQRIQLDFASKTGSVDVAYMPFIYTSKWASTEWVQPIDKYVEADKADLNINDFISSAVDAMRYKDKLYGLPGFAEVGLMAYRKDIFDAKGIKAPPKTWDELLEVAKKINTPETAAIALRTQRGQGLNIFVFPMFMWSYGGSFVKNYPSNMTPVMNSENNKKALNMYKELLKYAPQGAGNFTNSDIIATMQAGKAAIIIDGTSVINEAIDPKKNQYADKIELALVPAGPNGSAPCYAVHGWAIPKFAKSPDLAWNFLKWSTSSQIQKSVAMGEGGESYLDFTRESVGNDQAVLAKYNAKNKASLRNEALKSTKADYRPLIPEWNEIGDIFGGHINAAVNNQESTDTALNNSQNEVVKILQKGGYKLDN